MTCLMRMKLSVEDELGTMTVKFRREADLVGVSLKEGRVDEGKC